jgi:hypothetical protein
MSHLTASLIADPLDVISLTRAMVVCLADLSGPAKKAVAMLVDEVEKRTGLHRATFLAWPARPRPTVVARPFYVPNSTTCQSRAVDWAASSAAIATRRTRTAAGTCRKESSTIATLSFCTNAIELVPAGSDDRPATVHSARPPLETMEGMSRLADKFGLAVWIW